MHIDQSSATIAEQKPIAGTVDVRKSKNSNGSTLGAYTYHYIISVNNYYGYSYVMTREGAEQILKPFRDLGYPVTVTEFE